MGDGVVVPAASLDVDPDPLGLGPDQAAAGVVALANTSLAAAIRLSLFEKGLDPRGFSLLSFGGAGGLHACDVAEELGMTEVVLPREPGTLSAYGILFSDLVQDIARPRLLPAEAASLPALQESLDALHAEAQARLEADGVAPAQRAVEISADLRYRGQAFELAVPGPEEPDPGELAEHFAAEHEREFGYRDDDAEVELVNIRVGVVVKGPGPRPAAAQEGRL